MKVFEEYIIPINETAKDYDEMFVGIIRRQPVLIRCKDCKYYRDDVGVCIGFGDGHYVMEEDFCSKAERRNDERME
jgi:hypothetical protein